MTQPPGNRTKPGSIAATRSARSLRSTERPLTGPTQVSRGMTETMSTASVDGAPARTAIRALVLVAVAVIATSSFCQVSLPAIWTVPVPRTAPSALSRRIARGCAVVVRAQMEAS